MPTEPRRKTQMWWYFVSLVRFVVLPLVLIALVACIVYARVDRTAGVALLVSIALGYIATVERLLRKPYLASFLPDPQCSKPSDENDAASWFIRVGVVNYGLTPAKECVGRLLEVRSADGQHLAKFDPLTLFWARQDRENTGFSPAVIQGGGDFEYLDIAQVKRADTTPLALRVVVPRRMSLTQWPADYPSPGHDPVLKPGTYNLLIGVHAADAYVRPCWFEITCDADVPDSCGDKVPCRIRKTTHRCERG